MIIFGIFFYLNTKKETAKKNEDFLNYQKGNTLKTRNENLPLAINEIPTINPTKGGGVDINSTEIINSKAEIFKITNKLPFNKKIKTSSGLDVEIMIPSQKLQDNDYYLTVYVFGINYKVANDARDYLKQRNGFLEGAKEVFSFLKQNNISNNEIIIKWGDKKYIRDKAENWIKEDLN